MPVEVFAALAVFAAVGGAVAWDRLNRARQGPDDRTGPGDPPQHT